MSLNPPRVTFGTHAFSATLFVLLSTTLQACGGEVELVQIIDYVRRRRQLFDPCRRFAHPRTTEPCFRGRGSNLHRCSFRFRLQRSTSRRGRFTKRIDSRWTPTPSSIGSSPATPLWPPTSIPWRCSVLTPIWSKPPFSSEIWEFPSPRNRFPFTTTPKSTRPPIWVYLPRTMRFTSDRWMR